MSSYLDSTLHTKFSVIICGLEHLNHMKCKEPINMTKYCISVTSKDSLCQWTVETEEVRSSLATWLKDTDY